MCTYPSISRAYLIRHVLLKHASSNLKLALFPLAISGAPPFSRSFPLVLGLRLLAYVPGSAPMRSRLLVPSRRRSQLLLPRVPGLWL